MKTIGIIGAMPSELVDIRKMLPEAEVETHSSFTFHINTLGDKKIINVCSGIAKVNAAVCAQVMIDRYNVDIVINAGIAGGMNREVKVCDIVIADEVMPHDLDVHFLQDYPPYCGIYKADERLIEIAKEVCEEFKINCFTGRCVSGEAFISSNEVKQAIIDKFTPYAVDMESSAIGHCCFLNKVPFANIRCISDNADDDGAMSFDEFEKIAAKRVAEIVLKIIEKI